MRRILPEHQSRRKSKLRPASRSPRMRKVPRGGNLFCAFLEYHGTKAANLAADGEATIPAGKMRVSLSLIYEWCRGTWRRGVRQRVLDNVARWFRENHGVVVYALELEELVTAPAPMDPEMRRIVVEEWLSGLRRSARTTDPTEDATP